MCVNRSARIFQLTKVHELRRLMRTEPRRVNHDQACLAMAAYPFDHISRGPCRFERHSQDLCIHAEVLDSGETAGIEGNQGDRSAFLKAIVGRELRDGCSLACSARTDK